MFKNEQASLATRRLTTLGLSVILTCGLVAASAPQVQTQAEAKQKIEKIINDCRTAYAAFRFGKDGGVKLGSVIASYPQEERNLLVVMCAAYGDGYEDGRRGIV